MGARRVTRAGSVHEAVAETVRAAGGTDAVAADLGVSQSGVSGWSDPDRGQMSVLQADRLGRIEPGALAPLARHFARLSGHMLVPAPQGEGPLALQAAALAKEAGEAVAAVCAALAATSPDAARFAPHEARRALVELEEAEQAIAVLVAACHAALREDAA